MIQEGEEKNICICPWDITAGRELPFFFFSLPSFILHQFLDHVEEKVTGDMQILRSHLWKPEIL